MSRHAWQDPAPAPAWPRLVTDCPNTCDRNGILHNFDPMRVFGLTGGVASGKGVVAARFRELGIPVLDADELAREVVAPGTSGLSAVVERFGSEILGQDGQLNRSALAQLVFSDRARLQELNSIVHPLVQRRLEQHLASFEAQGADLACYEVPLLFENGLQERLRPVVLVAASPDTQVARATKRSGWTEEQARARMAAQMPLSRKRRLADFIIDNDGSLNDTRQQATQVLEQVRLWRAP